MSENDSRPASVSEKPHANCCCLEVRRHIDNCSHWHSDSNVSQRKITQNGSLSCNGPFTCLRCCASEGQCRIVQTGQAGYVGDQVSVRLFFALYRKCFLISTSTVRKKGPSKQDCFALWLELKVSLTWRSQKLDTKWQSKRVQRASTSVIRKMFSHFRRLAAVVMIQLDERKMNSWNVRMCHITSGVLNNKDHWVGVEVNIQAMTCPFIAWSCFLPLVYYLE